MSKRLNTDQTLRELIAFIDASVCEVPSYIKEYLTLDPNTDELEILEKEEEYLEKRIEEVKNRIVHLKPIKNEILSYEEAKKNADGYGKVLIEKE